MPTHYEVLGVGPDADREAVRRAYVAIAKASHPDRRQAEDPVRRAAAEEQIRRANEAWSVLRDADRRRAYDRSLRGPSVSSGAPRPSPARTARPAPPSGVVVPAAHAGLWRYAPVVVIMVVLVTIFVVTAYATTSGDTGPGTATTTPPRPDVGDCVLVVPSSGGLVPVRTACGATGALRVSSVVATPRPCPSGLMALPWTDDETTLCLAGGG